MPRKHDHVREVLLRMREHAEEEDRLHDFVDLVIGRVSCPELKDRLIEADPGRLVDTTMTSALGRWAELAMVLETMRNEWINSFAKRSILVAGPFPPHLLEQILCAGNAETVIHLVSPAPHGGLPHHLNELKPIGLVGCADPIQLIGADVDVILVHGRAERNSVDVSSWIVTAIRLFPKADLFLLPQAPHLDLEPIHPLRHRPHAHHHGDQIAVPSDRFTIIPIIV